MVAVVQLVEHQVVILDVAGSSPVSHPEAENAAYLSRRRSLVTGRGQMLALPAFHCSHGMFQSPKPSTPGSVDPTVLTISTTSPRLELL